VAMAFVLTFTFFPSALLLFNKNGMSKQAPQVRETDETDDLLVRISDKVTRFVIARPNAVALTGLVLFAVVFAGVFKIGYVTNFTNYMPSGNQIKEDLSYVDKKYGGTVPIELVIRATAPENDFSHAKSLQLIDQIQRDIMDHMQGDYTSSFSVADYFKSINKAFNADSAEKYVIPDNDADVADFYELGEPDEIKALV